MAQEILNKIQIINARWRYIGMFSITLAICLFAIENYRKIDDKIDNKDFKDFKEVSQIFESIGILGDTIRKYQNLVNDNNNNPAIISNLRVSARNKYEDIRHDFENTSKSNPYHSKIDNLLNLSNEYLSNIDIMHLNLAKCSEEKDELEKEIKELQTLFKLDKKGLENKIADLENKIQKEESKKRK